MYSSVINPLIIIAPENIGENGRRRDTGLCLPRPSRISEYLRLVVSNRSDVVRSVVRRDSNVERESSRQHEVLQPVCALELSQVTGGISDIDCVVFA